MPTMNTMNTFEHSFGEEDLGMEANTFHSRQSQLSYVNSDGGEDATDTNDSTKQSKIVLAGEETKVVRSFRWFLLGVLVFFAFVIAGFVYVFTSRAEQDSFEQEFLSNGNKVINAFSADAYRKMQAMFALSTTMTGYALNSNSTWPFVTIPNLAHEFGPYLTLTDAVALTVFPIVPHELRATWEEYSVMNQGWIDDHLNQTSTDASTEKSSISPYIKNYVGIDTSPGVWLPWWQYHPVISNRWFVNFNRLAWKGFREQLGHIMEGKALLSEVSTFQPGLDFQSSQDYSFFDQLLKEGDRGQYSAGEPFSTIFYPIMEHFGQDPKVVAVLSSTVYWKSYLDSAKGIMCVVKNDAGQVFSYEVLSDGTPPKFLGMGDYHDTQFDETGMKLSARYNNWASAASKMEYTGAEIDQHYMNYQLFVYPTTELRDQHFSTNPIFYFVMIAVGFLLCAVIFILFNRHVEHRQKVVMRSAAKTTAVVESMFPSNVRDRLLAGVEVAEKKAGKSSFAGVKRIREDHVSNQSSNLSSDPIADEFDDTTIIFADIKGFTAWSEKQEPVQVFRLLESLYGAFDKTAISLGVYKVETVGDCYVAVSGLPSPNKHHAAIVCRFSRNMRKRFYSIVHDLEATMGPDTRKLELRIGIHSGAVTAGVIRGYNARFQLFGDTMNTASRMESTGEGGRIQISESTAALLDCEGKSNWYAPREDMVYCKGKGYLKTYWLHCPGSSTGSNEESKAIIYFDNASGTRSSSNMDSASFEDDMEPKVGSAHVVEGNTGLIEDALRLRMMGMKKNSAHRTKRHLEMDAPTQRADEVLNGNICIDVVNEVEV